MPSPLRRRSGAAPVSEKPRVEARLEPVAAAELDALERATSRTPAPPPEPEPVPGAATFTVGELLRARGGLAGPPPEGAPARGVPVASLPAGVRPSADYADRNGNFDGVLDSREVTEHAALLSRAGGGAPLSDANVGLLRVLYQLTNAGAPLAGTRMLADGSGGSASWPPPAARQLAAPGAVSPERQALAQRVVRAAGSATQADVDAVRAHVARLPLPILRALADRGIALRAARGSVVDAEPSLGRQQPRGWHGGGTFSTVPGVFHPQSRSVIVATEDDGHGGRRLGGGHGSLDLMVHEIGHALDRLDAFGIASGDVSDTREFRAAYDADRANLSRLGRTYLTQGGDAGREETFAETLAAYVDGNPFMPENTPHLRAYFDRLFDALERRQR